jgi:nitroimidazol reductase NimA-like FMN-containing flavoprotein (pyridoxamine 5'-phosphate oxidase superfamily)
MKRKGPWNPERVESHLAASRVPLRLACNGRAGHPVLASLWYVAIGDSIWCATQQDSSVARRLATDPRCAFEVAADSVPYKGVRGQATARQVPERGEEILRRLIDRYLENPHSGLANRLLDRVDSEVAIELTPASIFSWDYTERMTERMR